MTKELSQGEFRITRCRLPPEAFLLAEGPDLPPSDLIEKRVWNSIISFPDDVSMRTSDHHGTAIKAMHELWGGWIESFGDKQDSMWYVMLDAADELQACIYNSLCGFYRVAASCLRTALELTTIGAYFQLVCGSNEQFSKWKEGQYEIRFGTAFHELHEHSCTQPVREYINSNMGYTIFGEKRGSKAWARILYSELSDFAHSRPTHSSGIMWEGSNGPIYVPASFGKVYALYLDTVALAYVLLKLARPSFKLPDAAKHLFHSKGVCPSKVAVYAYEFLFGAKVISGLLKQ